MRSVRWPVGSSPRAITADSNACSRKKHGSLIPARVRTSSAAGAKNTSPPNRLMPS